MSRESRKFHVPDELANLYDFANTLDLRKFVHHGVRHEQAEERPHEELHATGGDCLSWSRSQSGERKA